MESIYKLLDYLPYSISNPLHSILNSVDSLSTVPTLTQLIPIFISLLALYATIISLYNTTKFALRAIWFTLKWGTLIAVLGSGIMGFKNLTGTGGNNSSKGVGSSTFGNVGVGDMINLGKKGIDWWSGEGQGGKRGSKRSASGSKRTWSRVNSEGEWDDPNEDSLLNGNGIEDVVQKVQEVVMTFWGGVVGGEEDDDSSSRSTKAKKLKKKKKKVDSNGGGVDMAGLAFKYAANQARKIVGL